MVIKDNKKTLFNRQSICGVLMIILALVVLLMIYRLTGQGYDRKTKATSFHSNWIVEYRGQTYRNVELSKFMLPEPAGIGETVILKNVIPNDFNYERPVIRIYSHTSTVTASINGKTVYNYGHDRYARGQIVGSGYNYININEFAKEKWIRITFTSTEYNGIKSFSEINIMNQSDTIKHIVSVNRTSFLFGHFLLILGVIIVYISGILVVKNPVMGRLFWLGLSSFGIGGWSVCYYKFVEIYNMPFENCLILEYACLHIATIATYLYFKEYAYALENKKIKAGFNFILGISLTNTIITWLLSIFNIIHVSSLLSTLHIMMFTEIIYVILVIALSYKKKLIKNKSFIVGAVILVCLFSADILSYFSTENLPFIEGGKTAFSPIGTVVFIAVLLLNFGNEISLKLKLSTEKDVLYRMAYTDDLTKISNRRFCDELMTKLSETEDLFGIISLDLNKLKETNDTLGHEYGDKLILGFANILKEVFHESVVGRMGGDEFIVIIEDLTGFKYEEKISQLKNAMAIANEKETVIQYDTSYGFATSHEVDKSETDNIAYLTYALADSRMYEHKREGR